MYKRQVQVPLSFSNVGAATATGMGYAVQLTGSPTGVAVSYNGTACGYNSGTGAITGCGLPATLTPGQSLGLVLTYTAPATGPVGVASTVTTGSTESNTTNNTATASTAITPTDMAVSLAGLPPTATVGLAYSGSFTCTNAGSGAAANAQCGVAGLPAGVSVGTCTVSPGSTLWAAGSSVPAGQTVTCTVSGTPTAAGNASVVGTTGATGDGNAANNTASLSITVGTTPPAAPTSIPTLGEWALMALSLLLALVGAGAVRGRSYS